MENSELEFAAFKAETTSSVSPATLENITTAETGKNFQQALIEDILMLAQKECSVSDLCGWLPKAILENFDLQGCQIELYNANHRTATLLASIGSGWSTVLHESRSLEQIWDIYYPLIEGNLTLFRSGHPAVVGLSPDSLAWLGCPMVINAKLLGAVWLTRPEQTSFSETEQHQLKQLIDVVAIALHQAQLRETIGQQQTEIQQLQKSKEEFLKLISHELFVPLGNIQLSTQTLEKIVRGTPWRAVPQKKTILKVVSLLSQECRRQKQFVDNLITLMFPANQTASEPVLMDLSSWLPSLLRTFKARFEEESLNLTSKIPQEPILLESDINQLERTMTELINNALHYTPADKTVTLKVKAIKTTVEIEIANTGVHIPTQHQPYVFDKFYRIPELNQKQYGGSGLGLAIAKQLVTNLGGTLELKSTKQKTIFTVTLPR